MLVEWTSTASSSFSANLMNRTDFPRAQDRGPFFEAVCIRLPSIFLLFPLFVSPLVRPSVYHPPLSTLLPRYVEFEVFRSVSPTDNNFKRGTPSRCRPGEDELSPRDAYSYL